MTAIVTAAYLVRGLAARIHDGIDADQDGDNKLLKDAMVEKGFFDSGTGGTAGVTSFNGRTGVVTLGSSDIKTVNGQSLLGSGNITISGGTTGVTSLNGQTGAITLKTVNGQTLTGSGDITISGGTTGVTSLNGQTGAVTLTAGTGISITGTTISATGTGSGTAGVTSFNGRTGVVTLNSNDIKTVNGQSLLGSGNITISAGTTPTLDAVVKAGNTTSTSASFNGGAILSGLTVGGTVLQPSWRATIRGGSSDDTALLCYNLSAPSGGRILALACSSTSVALAAFFYGNPGAAPTPPSVGSITTNGVSVSYNTTSDYRLKDNIVDLDNALVRVNQLKPRRFSWRANPSIITEGFIAHEVAEIIPEVITGEKDAVDAKGEIVPQNIDHSKLIPILTAAIKELTSELSILRDRINKLEQNVTT